jgi:gas vesicle protein
MAKVFMPEASNEERLRILRDNHDSEITKYYKQLSQHEMDQRRETLAENSIEHFELSEQLKEVKADFKEKMEPLIRDNHKLMQEIKTGQAEVEGEIFFVPDHDNSMMETYNADGEMIASRRLKPEEKQQRISFLKPAVNQ